MSFHATECIPVSLDIILPVVLECVAHHIRHILADRGDRAVGFCAQLVEHLLLESLLTFEAELQSYQVAARDFRLDLVQRRAYLFLNWPDAFQGVPGNQVLVSIEVLISFSAPGAGFVVAAVDLRALLLRPTFLVTVPLLLEVRERLLPGAAVRWGRFGTGRFWLVER